MALKNTTEIVGELGRLLSAGNINTSVIRVFENWDALKGCQDLVLENLAECIKRCRQHLSPLSIERLQSLPASILAWFAPYITANLSAPVSPPAIGRVWFPVVTSFGSMRELVVEQDRFNDMSNAFQQQLSRVGAEVNAVLTRRTTLPFVWHPQRYSFRILDVYGNEDTEVGGRSMDLALALALYSLLTRAGVPANVSATARIESLGIIKPVNGITEKLEAISREKPNINRVIVADTEKSPGTIPSFNNLRLMGVASLAEALTEVFPDVPALGTLAASLDVDETVDALMSQYTAKLYTTCEYNAYLLIDYLNGSGCCIPVDTRVPALLSANWRLGSCLSHAGDIQQALAAFKIALDLYEQNQGLIGIEAGEECRNSYAVLLKDAFHYAEAEALHLKGEKVLKKIGARDYKRAKNLSSLSQLYLAQRRFEEAATLQQQAVQMIREKDRNRNYGLLAQVYTRWGLFEKADESLNEQSRLINLYKGDKYLHYHRWIRSEFLYRRGLTEKSDRRAKDFAQLHALQQKVLPEGEAIAHYTTALILKFDGLARLTEGDEKAGMDRLEACIGYFDTIPEPMFSLIGAAVRAKKALYIIEVGRPEKAKHDVGRVAEALSQEWFVHYFGSQVSILSEFGRTAREKSGATRRLVEALKFVRDAIPY